MIAIAGGIGSGKSVVSRILRLRGWGVFDCDMEARRLMSPPSPLAAEICRVLGENVYAAGVYDRRRVSDIIFSDPEKRSALNELVHTAVKNSLKEWTLSDRRNVFVECALAGQSGILEMADEVIWVKADKEERIRRIRRRDGHDENKILSIMEAQKAEEELIENCGRKVTVVLNDGEHSLLAQLAEFDNNLKQY